MKKFRLILLIIIVASILSFKVAYDVKNSTAEVDQQQGIYIFSDCKPVKEYEYLGTVKISLSWSGKHEELVNQMIKKAKKDYPKCDAIVISFSNAKADAIKFK